MPDPALENADDHQEHKGQDDEDGKGGTKRVPGTVPFIVVVPIPQIRVVRVRWGRPDRGRHRLTLGPEATTLALVPSAA